MIYDGKIYTYDVAEAYAFFIIKHGAWNYFSAKIYILGSLISYLQDEDLKQHNIFSICALEDRSTSGKLCSVFRYFADLFSSNSNSRLNYEPTERYSAKTEQDSVIW